jgi:hypothetical protein
MISSVSKGWKAIYSFVVELIRFMCYAHDRGRRAIKRFTSAPVRVSPAINYSPNTLPSHPTRNHFIDQKRASRYIPANAI